ncbi:S41 family peptidase [Deinococcus sp.]|uniref:S41 family peptidase n=1 Tax=Deinococcus sp. TaxID=47478 RepID=UPI0025C7022D|nr:S41 family peptidase [Deinococcus sp.]
MKRPLPALLGLTLLLAGCGQQASEATPTISGTTSPGPGVGTIVNGGAGTGGTTAPTTNTSANEIPPVPRVVSATPDCTQPTIAGEIARTVGPNLQDRGTLLPAQVLPGRVQAQGVTVKPNSVTDLLYQSKQILNELYFGYSAVDLNGLHEAAYQSFKTTFPSALNSYPVTDAVDPLMARYIGGVKDDHTYYLDAAHMANFNGATTNAAQPAPRFGFVMVAPTTTEGVLITDVQAGGPAFVAGLRRGDVVLGVDGQNLKRTVQPGHSADGSVDDSQQDALYSRLFSAAALKQTGIPFLVRRGSETRTVTVTAAILGGTELPWGEVRQDANGKAYYYLRIPSFEGKGIADQVHRLVAQASAQNVGGIVVDLRDNGGGMVREYVGAVGAFAPATAGESIHYLDASQTTISYVNGRVQYATNCSNTPQTALIVSAPSRWSGKVAVLLDQGSASASEMFSQNIRQGGHSILIGEESYGVGNTSTFVLPLPVSRGLSVTAGRVYVGSVAATETVKPDIRVANDTEALAVTGNDTALAQAFQSLSGQP